MLDVIKKNKIILALVVIVIIAFAWFGLSDRQPTSSTSILTNETRSGGSAAEQEILRLLLDMRSIRLDSSIFESPAFASLRDFGQEIIPEPVGRTNPFAPVGSTRAPTPEEEAADAVFTQ